MIRARKAPRPDSCCVSADVLTAPERHADRAVQHAQLMRSAYVAPHHVMRWGDVERIRNVLQQIRGTL